MSFDLQLFGSYSNYDYYTEFNGSSSADTMYNHASNVIINAGAGDDYIENYGSNTVTINGGTGNDTISRLGNSNVIAYASGDGNDSVAYSAYTSTVNIKITDDSSYTTSNGALGSTVVQIGSGSITIERGQSQTINIEGGSNNSAPDTSGHSYSNYDYYTTFNGGVGNDTMYNHASNVIIDAGDGDDYIDNYGNNTVTIKGGAGDDTIYRVGSNNVIEYAAGDGNDSVAASAYTSTINIKITDDSTYVTTAGALSSKIIEFDNGSITIEQGQNQTVSIEGGVYVGGPDTVGHSYSNYDYYTTFNGGLGNDTMYNHASNVIIDAGDGDDYIDNYGNNTVTIKGGAGNDTIYRVGSNNVIEYASGDGNDSVAASAYTSTINIKITDDSSYVTTAGALSSKIIEFDNGSITIEQGQNQTVSIEGGVYVGGSDTVGHSYSNYDYYTTFNGGLGNDTMYNHASNVIIDAGDGDDYIDNYGNNTVTIKGGAGDDTIYRVGSNNVIEYASGDGNDSVAYSAYTNTINIDITDGSSYSTAEGDLSAMIVNIGGGSIVIERGMTQEVNINGGNVSSGGSMPNGLNKVGDTINVSTNYNGGVWLTGFDILNWRECYADATAIEVNASSDGTSGRVIVGNEQSNMLRAGYNGAWLWGYLGDDTLVGGAGSDMFWFGKGEGSDVIDDCNDNDLVNLWSINLSDVMSFDVDDNDNISVGFSDGNRLKVNTTGSSTTFQLADVGRWKLDHGSRSFSYVPS